MLLHAVKPAKRDFHFKMLKDVGIVVLTSQKQGSPFRR